MSNLRKCICLNLSPSLSLSLNLCLSLRRTLIVKIAFGTLFSHIPAGNAGFRFGSILSSAVHV